MKIDETSSAATPPPARAPGLQGSKDEFLKLFMAQLQHQDPFAPTSGADMVAQLAQLSSVEQAKQMSDQLADIAAGQQASANASLANLVGRDCVATASAFQVGDGGVVPGGVPPLDLATTSPTKGAAIVIKNAAGDEIRRIPIPDGTRATTIAWDGLDAKGAPVARGDYQISVDAGASASEITTRWHGRVDAVELTPEGPRLRMGKLLVAPGDIRTIGERP